MNYDIALLNHYGKETIMLMTYETLFIAKLIILLFVIFYSRHFLDVMLMPLCTSETRLIEYGLSIYYEMTSVCNNSTPSWISKQLWNSIMSDTTFMITPVFKAALTQSRCTTGSIRFSYNLVN